MDAVPAKVADESFFLDITPLRETQWTGVAEVTRRLARYLLREHNLRCFFFDRDGNVIDPAYVAVAVDEAPGGYLSHFIASGAAVIGSIHASLRAGGHAIGLFPSLKPFHRVFDVEVSILHDLSPILMPETHRADTVESYGSGMQADCASSDLICCVSHATEADARLYLAVPAHKTFVAHLGRPEPGDPAQAVSAPYAVMPDTPRTVAPHMPSYAVVLGTLEPRKNLRLVAEFLRCQPEVCKDLAIFFVGREGWGRKPGTAFDFCQNDPLLSRRVAFTGFLPEEAKVRLLRGARFSIYPSLFEGFGLPVLESMALGCPVIASRSSSIVELGLPDHCLFDPLSLSDFARAFHLVNDMTAAERGVLGSVLRQTSSAFSWERFGETIVARARLVRTDPLGAQSHAPRRATPHPHVTA